MEDAPGRNGRPEDTCTRRTQGVGDGDAGGTHGGGHNIATRHMEDVGRRWKTLLEDVGKPREIAWKT